MKMRRLSLVSCLSVLALVALVAKVYSVEAGESEQRTAMQKTMQAGNFKDAYEGFRKLALSATSDPRQIGNDLNHAIQCLQRLNRVNEIDDFREAVIKVHGENWRLLQTAAQSYLNVPHHGYMIAGEFRRGHHRGGGRVVNAAERDRVRALQLMVQAMPLAQKDDNKSDAGNFFMAMGRMWMNNRGAQESWRLQYLTNLAELPDYDDGWGYARQTNGAPVDEEGNPVFHHVPKSWEAAKTDGERYRWSLMMAAEMSPGFVGQVRYVRANFLFQQFGVQTMRQYGFFFQRGQMQQDRKKDESGTYALHTLKDTETIAKLATGIKRFDLPDEFNYIKLFQQLYEDRRSGYAEQGCQPVGPAF